MIAFKYFDTFSTIVRCKYFQRVTNHANQMTMDVSIILPGRKHRIEYIAANSIVGNFSNSFREEKKRAHEFHRLERIERTKHSAYLI